MILNNIFLIIIIFIIVGVSIYIYYQITAMDNGDNITFQVNKYINNKAKKQVRFNHKIKTRLYDLKDSEHSNDKKTSMNNIPDDIKSEILDNDTNQDYDTQSPIADLKTIDSMNDLDANNTWDSSFGIPLMNKDEKKKYFNKVQKNFIDYGKSMSEFEKYLTDRSTIIQTETTIDPFKPDHRSGSLENKTIQEIYDQQTAGPKAKPMKIKSNHDYQTIYDNDSEMNTGQLNGSNLKAYDNFGSAYPSRLRGCEYPSGLGGCEYQSASFGNGFT